MGVWFSPGGLGWWGLGSASRHSAASRLVGFPVVCIQLALGHCAMLCVRMLSGEELAKVPLDEVSDVRSLKQHLHQLHGLPPRFRQRILLHGQRLDDATRIDSSQELEIVLLTYTAASDQDLENLPVCCITRIHG